jgi:quercetin dioxygenase-like cupin family protein
MTKNGRLIGLLGALFGVALLASWGLTATASAERGQDETVRLASTQVLPRMDGGHLEVKAVEVDYAPGGSSSGHSHPCAVIGYVAEGAIRSQVNDGPELVYKAGDTFYEAPNGAHRVSANASETQPARLVAFFVCDHETQITQPIPEQNASN